jgi:hypothetical protein
MEHTGDIVGKAREGVEAIRARVVLEELAIVNSEKTQNGARPNTYTTRVSPAAALIFKSLWRLPLPGPFK